MTLETMDLEALAKMSDAEMNALTIAHDPAEDVQADTATAGSSDPATAAGEKVTPKAEEPKPEDPPPPEGVIAKDGEHILPYSVVENLRREKAELEQQLKDMQASKEPPKEAPALPTVEALTPEQLAALEEEVPALASAIRTLQGTIKTQAEQLAKIETERTAEATRRHESEADARRRELVDAIEATPKLALVRATDPDAFKAIQQIDVAIMSHPATAAEWKGKPLADRFAHVVKLYETSSGKEIQIKSVAPADAKPTPAQAIEPQTAKPVQTKTASLSDIPGGTPPASDSRAEIAESKSGADVMSKLAGMSPTEIDSFMAKLIS